MKIRELAQQAWTYAIENNPTEDPRGGLLVSPCLHQDFDNKFADLIIQECVHALNPMLRDMISRGDACDIITNRFYLPERVMTNE